MSDEDLEALRGYTRIEGNLSVVYDPYDDPDRERTVTSLGALHCLTSVGGTVNIAVERLSSLAGLQNLTTVDGGFWLGAYDVNIDDYYLFNTAMEDLGGLERLSSVGGDFYIYGNTLLEHLDALSNLRSIGGSLVFAGNESLTNLDGLRQLTTIGGRLDVIGFCREPIESAVPSQCDWHESLRDLDGLRNVVSVAGGLEISNNPLLESLDGLSALETLGGGLRLTMNERLASIAGLGRLTEIPGWVALLGNPALASLAGLEGVERMRGALEIGPASIDFDLDRLAMSNDALTTLAGLERLRTIEVRLSIHGNPVLARVDGLDTLEAVGALEIAGNPQLVSLQGLNSLRSANSLQVTGNPMLPTCEAEWVRDNVTPEFVTIMGNDDAGTCP